MLDVMEFVVVAVEEVLGVEEVVEVVTQGRGYQMTRKTPHIEFSKGILF